MIKEAIATGDTVEVAFANACRELGVDTTDADCEVLEMPQKKTLGLFGGRPAKVRAYLEIDDPVEKPAVSVSQPEREIKKPVVSPQPVQDSFAAAEEKSKKQNSSKSGDPAQDAANYLQKVLTCMGLSDAVVTVKRTESGADLTLSGEDVGFVIGHRGETLDALQYLASLVANHIDGSYYRLTLDVGNYREKRRETLETLGRKMAYRAVKTGRNSSLEPMNPYERRIIHTAVQTVDGAKSWSEGEDQARHVVIGPEGGERFQSRRDDRRGDNRRSGRGGYNSGGRGYDRDRKSGGKSQRNSRSNVPPRAEGPKADDPGAPIYGKIEVKK